MLIEKENQQFKYVVMPMRIRNNGVKRLSIQQYKSIKKVRGCKKEPGMYKGDVSSKGLHHIVLKSRIIN